MGQIWKQILLEWKGETYEVRPTIELLASIESRQGCSLKTLIKRIADGDLPTSTACQVISATLRYAGVRATPEEVFTELRGGLGGADLELTWEIVSALLPPVQDDAGDVGAKKKAEVKTELAQTTTHTTGAFGTDGQ